MRNLLLLLMALLTLNVSAFTVEIEGVHYELQSDGNVAELKKVPSDLLGSFVIPEYVEYEGAKYVVTTIGSSALSGCKELTSVTIPNTVTSIEREAFSGCSNLTIVNVPSSLKTIGYLAFTGCRSLASMTIPNSVTYIGGRAFQYCSSMISVTLPNSITSIDEGVFYGCSALYSLSIPNNVTSIRANAFNGCSSLASVNIPNNLTIIERATFEGCNSLTSIAIPSSVKEIESYAFYDCNSLKNIYIDDLTAWCNISFHSRKKNDEEEYGYSNPLHGAEHLFLNGEEITDLAIPNGVTLIKDYAFIGYKGLNTVSIPSSVNSIGESAFSGCWNLTSVSIPGSVKAIGSYAFWNCSKLESVSISNGVTEIGKSAFHSCELKSVTIPNSVTSIGEYSFAYCYRLSSVILPEELKIIKSGLFRECRQLRSIVIPSKVEYIYQWAFADSGLKEVKVLAETPPLAYDNTFSNYQIPLYVPASSFERYQTSSPWNKFASFKAIEGEDVQVKKCEKPTISYNNGEISFSCETEDVEFVSSIADSDIKSYAVAKIPLNVTYTINVRARKAGYQDSDVATATLCWIDTEPQTEGVSSVTQVRSYSVMIQNDGGTLNIQGVNDGLPILVYEANGKLVGTGISRNGKATVNTDLQTGAIAIVKIGERSVKVVIK